MSAFLMAASNCTNVESKALTGLQNPLGYEI
jgi:hypothetical protein